MKFIADIKPIGLPGGSVDATLRCLWEGDEAITFVTATPPQKVKSIRGERVIVKFGLVKDKATALEEMRLYVAKMFPGKQSVLLDIEAFPLQEQRKPKDAVVIEPGGTLIPEQFTG